MNVCPGTLSNHFCKRYIGLNLLYLVIAVYYFTIDISIWSVDRGAAEVMAHIALISYFFFFAVAFTGLTFSLVVLANERTQRKPM